jgi:hypothetical protein
MVVGGICEAKALIEESPKTSHEEMVISVQEIGP